MARILNWIFGPHRFDTRSPWGVLTGMSAIFAGIILSLVAVIGLGLAATILLPEQATGMRHCLSVMGADGSAECGAWALGLTGVWAATLVGAFYGLVHLRAGSTPANSLLLRAANLRWWQYAVLVVVMVAILISTQFLVSLITGASQEDFEKGIDYLKAVAASGEWQMWLLIIAVVVVAGPLAEEFLFRGFMFTMLVKTRAGFIGAATITSLCWTLLHYNYGWQILVVLFVFGMCLAYSVWRTGSLWPGIIVHGANNLISAVVLVLR